MYQTNYEVARVKAFLFSSGREEVIEVSHFRYLPPFLSTLGKPNAKYLTPLIFKFSVSSALAQARIWVLEQVKLRFIIKALATINYSSSFLELNDFPLIFWIKPIL